MKTAEIIETLRAHNEWRRGNDGGGEMLAPKLVGEAIDAAVEVLENGDTGWRKKWECAVEMAALAEIERDEWSQRATRYGAERESNAMQALAYKSERDAALDALRKWHAVCVAADVCNAEMESDEYSQTQWEAFEQKHTDLLGSANRARLAVLFHAKDEVIRVSRVCRLLKLENDIYQNAIEQAIVELCPRARPSQARRILRIGLGQDPNQIYNTEPENALADINQLEP